MTVFVLRHHGRSRWLPQLLQTHGRVDNFLSLQQQILNNNHGGRIQAVKGTRHSVFSTSYWTYHGKKTMKAGVSERCSTITANPVWALGTVFVRESMIAPADITANLLWASEVPHTVYTHAKLNNKLRWRKTSNLCQLRVLHIYIGCNRHLYTLYLKNQIYNKTLDILKY